MEVSFGMAQNGHKWAGFQMTWWKNRRAKKMSMLEKMCSPSKFGLLAHCGFSAMWPVHWTPGCSHFFSRARDVLLPRSRRWSRWFPINLFHRQALELGLHRCLRSRAFETRLSFVLSIETQHSLGQNPNKSDRRRRRATIMADFPSSLVCTQPEPTSRCMFLHLPKRDFATILIPELDK